MGNVAGERKQDILKAYLYRDNPLISPMHDIRERKQLANEVIWMILIFSFPQICGLFSITFATADGGVVRSCETRHHHWPTGSFPVGLESARKKIASKDASSTRFYEDLTKCSTSAQLFCREPSPANDLAEELMHDIIGYGVDICAWKREG